MKIDKIFPMIFFDADTGNSGGENDDPEQEEADLKDQLKEAEETIKRLNGSLKQKEKDLEALVKDNQKNLSKTKEVLKNSLADLDKIKTASQHLGLEIEIEPSLGTEEIFKEVNEKIRKEFQLANYKLSELDYENDFDNLVALAKDKLLNNKRLGISHTYKDEISYEMEDTLEFQFSLRKFKGA